MSMSTSSCHRFALLFFFSSSSPHLRARLEDAILEAGLGDLDALLELVGLEESLALLGGSGVGDADGHGEKSEDEKGDGASHVVLSRDRRVVGDLGLWQSDLDDHRKTYYYVILKTESKLHYVKYAANFSFYPIRLC